MIYKTAGAFRTALENRLNTQAPTAPDAISRLRKAVAFERLMARLQAEGDERLLLKGGFALQLRASGKARFTRDLDMSANLSFFGSGVDTSTLGNCLREGSGRKLGDFFVFEVGPSVPIPVNAGPNRAFRFPIKCFLDGRIFETFHADTGVGDPLVEKPTPIAPLKLLEFSGLPPVQLKAIAPEQHFAEKLHALTLKRKEENSRVRDLVDLMILLDLNLDPARVLSAVKGIFGARATHPVPQLLEDPPASWGARFPNLAMEVNLAQATVAAAMARLRKYWATVAGPAARR